MSEEEMHLVEELASFHADMIRWRHELHRCPEVSQQEERTAATIASLLRSFGVDEVVEAIGGTGVVGVIRNGSGPVIGLRAELDALPMQETSRREYRSARDGVMHACGHDGHMAMLLGAARHLAEKRNFKGTAVLIFQPAEETATGAWSMIRDGLLDRYNLESVFALHNWPGMPEGSLCVAAGAVTASVNNITITVTGRGAHAAAPHLSSDPMIAGSAIVCGLQTIVSRNVAPPDPAVLSVTSFQSSSTAHNIIPRSVEIKGTARYFDSNLDALFSTRIDVLSRHIAEGYGVSALVEYENACPPSVNADKQARYARGVASAVVGAENLFEYLPVLIGDDFSFFLQRTPGVYAFIGNGRESDPVHSPSYDFNDRILPIGASFLAGLIEKADP